MVLLDLHRSRTQPDTKYDKVINNKNANKKKRSKKPYSCSIRTHIVSQTALKMSSFSCPTVVDFRMRAMIVSMSAGAMDEFHRALKAPEVTVIALFPKEPVAFQRIWCVFEIWIPVVNDTIILPTMSEESFSHCKDQLRL